MNKINELLSSAQVLSVVAEGARQAHPIIQQWQEIAGTTLSENSLPLRLNQDKQLSIGVENAAWASRIRLAERQILQKINTNNALPRVDSIKAIITDDPFANEHEKRRAQPLGNRHAAQLNKLAKQQGDHPLGDALRRLASKARDDDDKPAQND